MIRLQSFEFARISDHKQGFPSDFERRDQERERKTNAPFSSQVEIHTSDIFFNCFL